MKKGMKRIIVCVMLTFALVSGFVGIGNNVPTLSSAKTLTSEKKCTLTGKLKKVTYTTYYEEEGGKGVEEKKTGYVIVLSKAVMVDISGYTEKVKRIQIFPAKGQKSKFKKKNGKRITVTGCFYADSSSKALEWLYNGYYLENAKIKK